MAKLKVFSVFDSKLQVWMNPMVMQHTGQAERMWMEIVNDGQSLPSKHPSDFALYQVGEFDDNSGMLTALAAPTQVMTGTSAKKLPEGVLPLERS